MKKYLSFFVTMMATASLSLDAAEPANYYKSCEGKTGQALLTALQSVVSSHTNVGYDGLWEVYKDSDVDANGLLWDMYSTKRWSTTKERCGNYKNVGDCVNREQLSLRRVCQRHHAPREQRRAGTRQARHIHLPRLLRQGV